MGVPYILISILLLLIILMIIFITINRNKNSRDTAWNHLNLVQFIAGICVSLIGAIIMFQGNIFGERNSEIATIIGIFGCGLIATSHRYKVITKK